MSRVRLPDELSSTVLVFTTFIHSTYGLSYDRHRGHRDENDTISVLEQFINELEKPTIIQVQDVSP